MSPRNSSGTMSATNGPYISGTTISSTAINARFGDVEAELSDSASRSGKGSFSAPIRGPDGTVAAPAHSFTSEVGSGLYRAAAGDLRLAVGGVDVAVFNGTNSKVMGVSPILQATATNTSASVQGNRAVTDTGVDVTLTSTAVRTAGLIAEVQNGGFGKLDIDYLGLVRLVNQAAALQPASIWTAITPDTNIAASRGLGYTKDAVGKVHIRGLITNNTGGNIVSINASNPLPAGFRPTSRRDFMCSANNSPIGIDVSVGGVLEFFVAFPAGGTVALDGISFFAEQ